MSEKPTYEELENRVKELENLQVQKNNEVQNYINGFEFFSKDLMYGMILLRVFSDTNKEPSDMEIVRCNSFFSLLIDKKQSELQGQMVRDVFEELSNIKFNWVAVLGRIALSGGVANFEYFSKKGNNWYSVYAHSPMQNYTLIILQDITGRKLNYNAIARKVLVEEGIEEGKE